MEEGIEEELDRRVMPGQLIDQERCARIFVKHPEELLAREHDAEELHQEVLLGRVRHGHGYRPRRRPCRVAPRSEPAELVAPELGSAGDELRAVVGDDARPGSRARWRMSSTSASVMRSAKSQATTASSVMVLVSGKMRGPRFLGSLG